MDSPDLVNLEPIARLALLGLVLAAGPLAWVWARHRQADYACADDHYIDGFGGGDGGHVQIVTDARPGPCQPIRHNAR